MARKPRIHYPGAVYHVILRGNSGDPIFFEDRDRYRLYLILQHAVEKFRCRIHGFCFMTNPIHIVMQTGEIPLSRIMQNISIRYTKWINFTRSRTGHLFQGRDKAFPLDADEYLHELIRYVHLNPVRVEIVPGLKNTHGAGTTPIVEPSACHGSPRIGYFHSSPALSKRRGQGTDHLFQTD
ncbi:MAG: transposase [Geobacteraceae bacterium]|nr:transposase [Geobacteraceae bacterium]